MNLDFVSFLNNKNLDLKTTFCVYLCCLSVVFKFV